MAKVMVSDSLLTDIADAIRTKRSKTVTFKLSEMPSEILAISGGGSAPNIIPLDVDSNGTYNPPAGVDGYGPVNVQVDAVDVIGQTFTRNGTYMGPTGVAYNPITVKVPIRAVHGMVDTSVHGSGEYFVNCGFRPKHISLIPDINNGASSHHSTYDEDADNIRESGAKYTIPGNNTTARLKSIYDNGFSFYVGTNTLVGVWYAAVGDGVPQGLVTYDTGIEKTPVNGG